ncbi:Bud site selection protein 22 [Candida viswanathii]|uniref:Bud site selection protein 22 n=1 Tax=Candida viswanathii TaxID=5486 RepID=A0A367YK21_9ASCO|nr:Bud site selection protein 22 [Candida viswanathii]
MKSNNQMWKLDFLEAKFNKSSPRYPHTKKLLIASNHNQKLVRKLPKIQEDAQAEIDELKRVIFLKKYHSGYTKLSKEVSKKEVPVKEEEFVRKLITSRLVKSIQGTILTSKALKSDPPKYINGEVREVITDKENDANPSRFYIKYCQNDKEVNKFVASLWNNKNIKKILDEIEWSFRIVRGDLTKLELASRSKATGKEVDEELEDESEDEEDEEEEGDDAEIDLEKAYDNFAIYDELAEGSDNEDEEQVPDLDPNVNYNEITDEEPSEESSDDEEEEKDDASSVDDFFEEEPPKKKQKKQTKEEPSYNLPELATGYFSGGSDDEDDDVDNDKVVKEITTQRKNRRGQRARQKIWAKKYGKEATHVKKNQQRIASEREQRQLEYEERQRKRELKAKLLAEKQQTGANALPLGERKPGSTSSPTPTPQVAEPKGMHPSWEAKKLEKEKMQNIKFQGKKVVFD